VEYRIFGPAGTPSEEFRKDLNDLLKLDDMQRNAIVDWFFESKDFDPFDPPLPSNIVASTLLPEQFQRAATCLRRLLWAWQEYGLQREDVERDLLLLGLDAEGLSVMDPVLARLSEIKQRVWAYDYARTQTIEGLLTMDAVNFICEARAVFGGFPVGSEKVQDSYKQFLGILPIVLMEITASDNYGNKERMAIQLSEEHFEWLRKAIARADEQLSILKERTVAVAFNGDVPK
jgi:hypothetical protein